MKDWYSYGEFNFTRSQILWALEHLQILRDGSWPSQHIETGYTGGRGKKQSKRAPHENPGAIASEIDARLDKCGLDAILLEYVYTKPEDYPWQIQRIAKRLNIDYRTIEIRIDTARRYISGKCPRWVECLGVGECSQCKNCRRFKDKQGNVKCTKKPRPSKTFKEFREHK